MSTQGCILIATADPDFYVLLDDTLAVEGYRSSGVASGSDLVTGALAQVPDLLLVDRDLPDLAGEEALKSLRAFVATRQIPAVVMIRRAAEIADVAAAPAGGVQFLQKPFTRVALLRAVRRALPSAAKPTR